MKAAKFLIVISVAINLVACHQKAGMPAEGAKADQNKTVNIKLSELALKKDPHCDMPLNEKEIADTTLYQGKIYGFCSNECKADFLKDPQADLSKK